MRQWLRRFRRPSDEEFAAEIETHLAHEIDEQIERGLPPEDARFAALRRFGNVTRHLERFREGSPWFSLETVWQDVRYGWRSLWRTPVTTTIAILALALGIGANAALYTVTRAVLLDPLRLPEVDRVFFVRDVSGGGDWMPLSIQEEVARLATPFATAGPWIPWQWPVRYGDQVSLEWIWFASDGATHALGLQPQLGRWPSVMEQRSGAPVAVLTHRLWHQYGEDPHVLGRQLRIYNQAFTIIGVAPPEFRSIQVGVPYSAAVPLRSLESLDPGILSGVAANMLGRLSRGQSLSSAAAQVAAWRMGAPSSSTPAPRLRLLEPREALIGPEDAARLTRILGVVSVMAALVLLLGCANLGSAMLAGSELRSRELAMRVSLGATRARLVQLLSAEFGILMVLSIAAALIVSRWVLLSVPAGPLLGYGEMLVLPFELTRSIVVFTACVSALSCAVFGLAPAFRSLNVQPTTALRMDGDTRTTGRGRSRQALLGVQIGTSSALLVSALLLQATVGRATMLGLGVDNRDALVLTGVSLAGSRHAPETVIALRQAVMERLHRYPGFVSAAFTFAILPVRTTDRVVIDGVERWSDASLSRGMMHGRVSADWVDPTYRATLGLPLLRGRDLTTSDAVASGGGVLVNDSLARQFWPAGNALGQRIRLYIPGPSGWEQARRAGLDWMPGLANFGWMPAGGSAVVVGVIGDLRFDVKAGSAPCVYFANGRTEARIPMAGLYVRMRGAPSQAARAVAEAIQVTLPDEPPPSVLSREEHVASQLSAERSALGLVAWFACGAVALSVLGVYGMAAHTIVRRAKEFAIRLALGSSPGALTTLALRSAIVPVVLGGGAGLAAGAICATRWLSPFIVGVDPLAPSVYLATSGLLGTAAFVALYRPARRVARLDPAITLKSE